MGAMHPYCITRASTLCSSLLILMIAPRLGGDFLTEALRISAEDLS
jgi:hypothetical protein